MWAARMFSLKVGDLAIQVVQYGGTQKWTVHGEGWLIDSFRSSSGTQPCMHVRIT